MTHRFHADLTPDESPEHQRKRIWLNFANGWTASVVLMASGANRGSIASLAAWPTDDTAVIELGEQEASPEEVAAWLSTIAAFPVRQRDVAPSGKATLASVLADYLGKTNVRRFTCRELAVAVEAEGRLGYRPSMAAVSRTMGRISNWRKLPIAGPVTFERIS